MSHVPLASEEEYVVSVPEEDSSDSDESDCERGLNPEETCPVPAELHVAMVSPDTELTEEEKQHQEEAEEVRLEMSLRPAAHFTKLYAVV